MEFVDGQMYATFIVCAERAVSAARTCDTTLQLHEDSPSNMYAYVWKVSAIVVQLGFKPLIWF